jgi:hypothetical protein
MRWVQVLAALLLLSAASPARGEGLADFSAPPPETTPKPPQPLGSASQPSIESGLSAAEATLWHRIQTSYVPYDFKDYLRRYPDGAFAPQARQQLATMCAEAKQELREVETGAVGPAQWQRNLHAIELEMYERYVDDAC